MKSTIRVRMSAHDASLYCELEHNEKNQINEKRR
jgi:hypothetical protein